MTAAETPVIIENAGRRLVGMLHTPAGGHPRPAVLLLHGFTASKVEAHRLFVQQARELARLGVASLRFDFGGCGDSEGEFHEMTVSSLHAEARAALAWLAARPEVDRTRVAVLGMSLGGMVAALLAGETEWLRAGVLWSPVTNPRRMIANRATPATQRQMDDGGVADLGGWAVGRAFVSEMLAADPLASLRHVRFPLLLLHGTADQTVPVGDSIAAVAALGEAGRDVTLHPIEGASHGYDALPWIGELLRTTTGWLGAHLCEATE